MMNGSIDYEGEHSISRLAKEYAESGRNPDGPDRRGGNQCTSALRRCRSHHAMVEVHEAMRGEELLG